jgi:thioredoxin 1
VNEVMKNSTMIIAGVVVVIALGIGVFAFSRTTTQSDSTMKKDEAMMPKKDATMEQKDAMMKKDDASMQASDDKMMGDKKMTSRYVEYSKEALDKVASKRRVLFFYASWCPTCKPADANFTQNASKIPEDVTLIRVNYNDPETDQEEKDLAKKYGITYQHTFVQIDGSGKEVTKWNGGQIDELLSKIK